LFEKKCATIQKNVKSHVFLDLKNVKQCMDTFRCKSDTKSDRTNKQLYTHIRLWPGSCSGAGKVGTELL